MFWDWGLWVSLYWEMFISHIRMAGDKCQFCSPLQLPVPAHGRKQQVIAVSLPLTWYSDWFASPWLLPGPSWLLGTSGAWAHGMGTLCVSTFQTGAPVWHKRLSCHLWLQHLIWVPVHVSGAPLQIELLSNTAGKAAKHSQGRCGRLRQVPSSWLSAGPTLAVVTTWGVNQWISLSASLQLYFSSK